jgi:hypothetical protein
MHKSQSHAKTEWQGSHHMVTRSQESPKHHEKLDDAKLPREDYQALSCHRKERTTMSVSNFSLQFPLGRSLPRSSYQPPCNRTHIRHYISVWSSVPFLSYHPPAHMDAFLERRDRALIIFI